MTLLAKVATGSAMAVRTIGWAAMCRTRSNGCPASAASTAAGSRRSTISESTSASTAARSNRLGSWSGGERQAGDLGAQARAARSRPTSP